MGGVELLSKRVGREKGRKNAHTYTNTQGGEGGRREREGEERKRKKRGVKEEVVRK